MARSSNPLRLAAEREPRKCVRLPIESRWLEVSGLGVHARVAGEGPPVVLVHGYGVSGSYMLPLAQSLAPSFSVFVPDLPGYGRSQRPRTPLGIADLAAALAGWLDAAGLQRRRTTRLTLILAEDVTATAACRPVVDDLRHPLDRKQRAPMTGMAGLPALLPPRPPRPAPLPQPGRIVARRQRRVTRVALQPLLELLNALRQRRQLRILRLQPRRQRQHDIDDRLASLRVDRLRVRPLHTRSFATPKRVPAD